MQPMTAKAKTGDAMRFAVLGLVATLAACSRPAGPPDASDAQGGGRDGRFAIAAAHPLATEAGAQILRRGGSAADAAVAVQAVLTLVEPQSSGIGGGAFLLHLDAKTGQVHHYDGRETAPAAVGPDLFLREDGEPLGLLDAVVGGHSIGVPGVVAALAAAHADHGALPWSDLFVDAIRHAEDGFQVTPRLHRMITRIPRLDDMPDTRSMFFTEDGAPLPVGATLRNPKLGASLRVLAAEGPESFYEGSLAEAIVAAATETTTFPSTMTPEDLAGYEARRNAPVCAPFRTYRLCAAPPPSSGVIMLQLMGLLERLDLRAEQGWTERALHLFAEASRRAYADRDGFMADDRVVPVPVEGLIDPSYLDARASEIGDRAAPSVGPGDPPGEARLAPDAADKPPSTSHFTIVDGRGDVVTMTTTVEFPFGSHVMAGGFILNNQLTDFSFRPEIGGQPVANAVAPGKKPRSSMSPVLVFDAKGEMVAALGSPGGTAIIDYVAKVLLAHLEWGDSLAEAIAAPNVYARGGALVLEEGRFPEPMRAAMSARGHAVRERALTSGVHAVGRTEAGYEAAADPRREGVSLTGDVEGG